MTADLDAELAAVCPQPDCEQPAGHDDEFHSLDRVAFRRDDLTVIWAKDRGTARLAAYDLQLDPRRVFCVGNRSINLRGLEASRALILPGADSPRIEQDLTLALAASRGPVLDLRGLSA